jgi:Carboxypeptidase regulatory-like domain
VEGLIVLKHTLLGDWKVSFLHWVARFALLLFFPLMAAAQDTGYLSGTVTDKSGAAISRAEVALTNIGKTMTRNTVTNDVGAYVIPGLPGDTYNLSVTAKGFQKFTASKVVLNVGDKDRIDVVMTIGAVTEEIVVTGESVAQVETTSSELGDTVTGKQVDQLILNGRNFTQLVNITPGVVSQTNQDEGTVGVYGNVAYAINGGRTEYNNWELDGGDNMDNGSNSTLNVYPSLDAISEFKVLTSNYGAQYGRNGSGTVEVETKSGTNAFHGSAYYYGRNEAFNARDWAQGLDNEPKAPYKKHDWGYTIGGPVFIPHVYNEEKKKTFFFWSQEWRNEKVPDPANPSFSPNVPSNDERNGIFNDVCPSYSGTTPVDTTGYPDCPTQQGSGGMAFPNNTLTNISSNAPYLLNLIPQANGAKNGFPAYYNTTSVPTTWREELIRVDHNITDNYRLTFRYIHDTWQTVTVTPLWGNGSSFPNVQTNFVGPGTSFVARLNANISPTLLNEFVASYTADHIFLTAQPTAGTDISLQGFQMGSLYDNGFGGLLPSFTLANGTAYGGGFSVDTGYFPWKNANPTYTYRDNMTWIKGNHTMQFGVYFAAAQKNQQNTVYTQGILNFSNTSANTTGNAFADLLQGNINSYQQAQNFLYYYDRYKNTELYFQDDWRVNRKLTLNLGLRWSFFGRYQEKQNQEYGFSPNLWSAANAPSVDPSTGALVTNGSGQVIGYQYNGLMQCGAKSSSYPGVSGGPTGCMQNKLVNPAPRIGFAWDPRGDGKMAIRGGYGIFFEHMNGNEANAESLQLGAAPNSPSSTQYSIPSYSQVGAGGGLLFPVNPFAIPSRSIWPYVQQWNLGVQKELPWNTVVSFAYVGSKGTHLSNQRDLNQLHVVPSSSNPFAPGAPITDADCANILGSDGLPDSNATLGNGTPVPSAALNNLFVACNNSTNLVRAQYPGFGDIVMVDNSANSIYNAFQASVRRTVGAFTFSLAYTYSHSIDDSSDRFDTTFVDSYNIKNQRASSNFDMRHNLAISFVYAVPLFKEPGLKNTLLGNWSLSSIILVQTGTPFSVTNGTGYSDSAGLGNVVTYGSATGSRPDIVSSPFSVSAADKSASAAGGVTGPLYYNPGAYVVPTGLTYGTVGRNTLNLPGRTNFDFGLFKRFPIKEKAAFEFRWETFNLFNHTQYNAINSGMDCAAGSTNSAGDGSCIASSGFLHLSGTHAARRMQFGLRFQF